VWRGEEDEDEDAPGTEARKRIVISRKPRYRDGASPSSTGEEIEPDSLASTRRSGWAGRDGDELELEHDSAGRRKVVSSMWSMMAVGLGRYSTSALTAPPYICIIYISIGQA
jgi:hypothetical protein